MTTELFAHPALFYRGSEQYLAGTVPFIAEGLAAGQPVAVAVPGPRLALLRAELGAAAEQVRMVDMTREGRNPGRIIPGVLRAFSDAHPEKHVRIVGEPIWPSRSETEYPACAQHEALINHAFAGRAATILCPYDADALASQILADAVMTHPELIDGGGRRDSAGYAPDKIVETYNQPLAAPADAERRTVPETNPADVRQFVAKYALTAGLDPLRADDLALAADELAANSIVHGGGNGTVAVWTERGSVVCQVNDAGHLTKPLAGQVRPPANQPGGRGLLLVNHLADLVRMHTTPSGTAIRAYFRTEEPPQDGHTH